VIKEGSEGVKWELGFGQIFTGKVGFGSLGLGFLKFGKTDRLGNGIWAKFGLGK